MSGFARQYFCEAEDGQKGEVFVYYYQKIEGGTMAIVDGIKLF